MENHIKKVFENESHLITLSDIKDIVQRTNKKMEEYCNDFMLEVLVDEFENPIINCVVKNNLSEKVKEKVVKSIYQLNIEERYSAKKQNILAKDLFDKLGGEDYNKAIMTNSFISNSIMYKPYFNYLRNLQIQIDNTEEAIKEINKGDKENIVLVNGVVLKRVFIDKYQKIALTKFKGEILNFNLLMTEYNLAEKQSYAVALNNVFKKQSPIKELLTFKGKKDSLEIHLKGKREDLIQNIGLKREKIFAAIDAMINPFTASELNEGFISDMYKSLNSLVEYNKNFSDVLDSKKMFCLFLNKAVIESIDVKENINFIRAKKRYDEDLSDLKNAKDFQGKISKLEVLVWEYFADREEKIVELSQETNLKKFKLKR